MDFKGRMQTKRSDRQPGFARGQVLTHFDQNTKRINIYSNLPKNRAIDEIRA
jgi:hypothetical protein